MSDFQMVRGFEDVWRPPVRPRRRTPVTIIQSVGASGGDEGRARLARIVSRAPEVMVKITGRTRDPGHLRSHLDYISRNGELELEDRDGAPIIGRAAVRELADDWSTAALADSHRRANTPFSHSVMLSMPAGTDPIAVRDAARAFAREVFADRFDYAFALHTDVEHPHVHLKVRSLGDHGERLNPKKADLDHWRQTFAQALRDRGVEAEATPRRARGVTRKAERMPLRKIADRRQMAAVQRAAYKEAAQTAFTGRSTRPPWEDRLVERQARIRSLYLGQAQILRRSPHASDRALADKVEAFVRKMPDPDSQRLALARELRAANRAAQHEPPTGGRDRPKTR